MARKAGSIVLDRLRERILLGRYFGCWGPDDRLPSVREVARLEEVDRKTAAAAYRRLHREGLVRVEPRSGVYLRLEARDDGRDPLRRLHRQWLENALATAAELGLDSSGVGRLLNAVAAVESRRIPVVDEDEEHARLLARELRARTRLDCAGYRPAALPAHAAPLREAPFLVATPAAAARLRPYQRDVPVIQATLAPALLQEVRRRSAQRPVTVVVATEGLARELGQALDHGLAGDAGRVRVTRPGSPAELDALLGDGSAPLVWPGAPDWALARTNGEGRGPAAHLIDDRTVREMGRQVARAALDQVSRSTAAVSR